MDFPADELRTAEHQLRLRRPRIEDAEALFASYCADPEVCRFMMWSAHKSVSDTREFLQPTIDAWESGEGHRVWIIETAEGESMGTIGATVTGHRAEVGYALAARHWGRGYMTDALACVTQHAFDAGLSRVQALADVDNTGSWRVMEKAGFVLEGVLRGYGVHPAVSDQPRDCRIYAKLVVR